MKQCFKCGHLARETPAPMACPACGAIYSKVLAAEATPGPVRRAVPARAAAARHAPAAPRRTSPVLVGLLAVAVLAAGGSWGYSWWQARQRHLAAVAHCGKADFARFDAEMKPAMENFDRVRQAVAATARIALGPMILELSKAQAEVAKIKPPPCAADGFKQLVYGMGRLVDSATSFATPHYLEIARDQNSQGVGAMLQGERAITAAREQAVQP